jgi:hypothetical protein
MESVDSKVCLKCGWKGETVESLCPRCRRKLQTQAWVRAMGIIMTLSGGFITVTMGGMALWLWSVVEQTGKPGAQVSFDGTKSQMFLAFGVMGVIFVFGVIALTTGLMQAIAARRNLMLTYIILGMFGVFYIASKLYLFFF